jgi:hypothetical protein
MDAIVGVWLTSLLGAAAFSTAGYVLGQRGVILPLLGRAAPAEGKVPENVHTIPTPVVGFLQPARAPDGPESRPPVTVPSKRVAEIAAAVALDVKAAEADAKEGEEDRPTFIPAQAAGAVDIQNIATLPPPLKMGEMRELETLKADLDAALAKADSAMQRARAAEAVKTELERQIEAGRAELRTEVVARAAATARADELGDRLASASAEASGLRHKVSLLDKQTRQLREALQGRVRALTTSEWHRRRDLEEAEEMRVKLRDVYDKIERSSAPPASGAPSSSAWPESSALAAPSMPRISSPAGSGGEGTLREEVARLKKENHELRARALGGSVVPKPRRVGSMPELDLDVYQELIQRASGVAGLRGVVVADETGSVLVGSGDLADGMAAFGAYIRDASSRTDRLLPLEGVEEVDIRDRRGMLLSTRVITYGPSELCVVLLGAADASLAAAKKIVSEHLRLD